MRVFVCPLDWGLGHAARDIPLIRYLIEKKYEVIIGAEGTHLALLKEHFPNVEYVDFPGYRIAYSKILPVEVMVFFQIPHMLSFAHKENKLLEELIEKKKINAVISDNRYGLWNKHIHCVIISHQLNIQSPVFSKAVSRLTHKYVKLFDECWIPDYSGDKNLSGILSHPIPPGINGKYLGPISRFNMNPASDTQLNKYDLLVILTGPEPQRSKLEEILLKQLKELPSVKALIIQGLPGRKPRESGLENVEMVPHLPDAEFQETLRCSEIILSRSGYTTIMDLYEAGCFTKGKTRKKMIFIPTPGQTEQEYIGKQLQEKGMAVSFSQKDFSLKESFEKVKNLNPIPQPPNGEDNYKKVMDEWLNRIGN